MVCLTQGGNDPQTEADRKAQRCIVNTLATRFPAITIYGEEVREQLAPQSDSTSLGGGRAVLL